MAPERGPPTCRARQRDGMPDIFWLFGRVTPIAILDILVVAAIIFWLLTIAQGTRALPLIRGVLILVAALAILNTMLMNVYDRLREIGLLRATGMDPGQTARMVLLEATAMGLVAVLVGSLMGLGLAWLVLQLAQTAEFQAPYVFPWREAVAALVVAIVLVPLVGAYPARYAARLNVVDALRGGR